MTNIRKYIYSIIALVFLTQFCFGANTTPIVGTAIDPDGQQWVNATWTATTVIPGGGGQAHYISGGIVPASTTGQLDSSGVFSGSLPNSTVIVPTGVTQRIKICSVTSAACQTLNPVAIPASTYNIGNYVSSQIIAPRFEAMPQSYAYRTSEISNAIHGSGYTNTAVPTTATQWFFDGSNWLQISGGGNITSAQIMNTLDTPPGYNVFGDSIGHGQGATNLSLGFSYILKPFIGGHLSNYSVVGNLCVDVETAIIGNINPLNNGSANMQECGTNDVTKYGTDTNLQTVFQRIVEGNLIHSGIVQSTKVYAQTCTKTTGFITADNIFRQGMSQSTVLSGDVLNCAVTTNSNGEVAVSYRITSGGAGTFTININGTNQVDHYTGSTTFLAYGDGSSNFANGTNSAFVGQIFSGFPANTTQHVIVTSTAVSATGSPVEVGYVAPVPSQSTSNPKVIVVSPNHQNNANDSLSGVYAGFEQTIATNLTTLGLNITYSNTRDGMVADPNCGNGSIATMFSVCYNDPIHPNTPGHASMATIIENSVPTLLTHAPQNIFNGPANYYQPNAFIPPNPSYFWKPDGFDQSGDGINTWSGGILVGQKGSNLFFLSSDPVRGVYLGSPAGAGVSSLCSYNPGSSSFPTYPSSPSTMPQHCGIFNDGANFGHVGGRLSDGLGGMEGANGDVLLNTLNEGNASGSVGQTYTGSAITWYLPQNNGTFSPAVNYPSVKTMWGINGCSSSSACGTVWTGFQNIPSAGNSPTSYLTLINQQSTTLQWGIDISGATQPNLLGDTTLHSTQLPGSARITATQGTTGTKLLACTGTFITGHIISTDASGNCIDGGAAPVVPVSNSATLTGNNVNVGSVATCVSATCTSTRGTIQLTAGGSGSVIGNMIAVSWTATPSAYVCTATYNPGSTAVATSFYIGNLLATTTGFEITGSAMSVSQVALINYSCQP